MADPPQFLVDYIVCKDMGWTFSELYEQDYETVIKLRQIVNISRQSEK